MLTLKILASLLQLHGPDATVQSDHQGIDALLNNLREQNAGSVSDEAAPTQVYFRRGGFARGGYGGAFRRGGGYYGGGGGAFRRGFARGY
jgi:hypothetical protein